MHEHNPSTSPEARLASLGLTLPPPPKPLALYRPVVVSGGFAWVSGQVPLEDGHPIAVGRVPDHVTEDVARDCARRCALSALAALREELGSLDRVVRVVKLGVFVASHPEYGGQPGIANEASRVMVDVFGEEAGRHARAAVGVASLPLRVPVEVECVFEVRPA